MHSDEPPCAAPRTSPAAADYTRRLSAAQVSALADPIAERFVAPAGCSYPTPRLRAELRAVARPCVELSAAALSGRTEPGERQRTRLAAVVSRLAVAGVPVAVVLQAVHAAFRAGLERLGAQAARRDPLAYLAGCERMLTMINSVSVTVSTGYVEASQEHPADDGAPPTAVSVLLGGDARLGAPEPVSTVPIAESYTVIALALAADPAEGGAMAAKRALRRVRSVLTDYCGDELAMLSVDGGTVLVPGPQSDPWLDWLVEQLAEASEWAVTAAVGHCPAAGVSQLADQLHGLLDLVRRLGRGPGLYRLSDMAFEFQLTRPGAANRWLRALLDPLDHRPELLDTLEAYIAHEGNRGRTARALCLSTNALNHRLGRIRKLTGHDPSSAPGMWQLNAAWVARHAK